MDLQRTLSANRTKAQKPSTSLGARDLNPFPSRWMAVPAVSERLQHWKELENGWETGAQNWVEDHKGHRPSLRSLDQLKQKRETLAGLEKQEGRSVEALIREIKQLEADFEQWSRFRPEVSPEGNWSVALTPQGPVLVQTIEDGQLQGGREVMAKLDQVTGMPSERVSLVHVLQLEPLTESQVAIWLPWAVKAGDAYLSLAKA